jgi:hypothetical protein
MVLLLSWVDGQPPYLDLLQADAWATAITKIMEAVDDDRHIRLYEIKDGTLTLVYPAATTVMVEGQLVKK